MSLYIICGIIVFILFVYAASTDDEFDYLDPLIFLTLIGFMVLASIAWPITIIAFALSEEFEGKRDAQ